MGRTSQLCQAGRGACSSSACLSSLTLSHPLGTFCSCQAESTLPGSSALTSGPVCCRPLLCPEAFLPHNSSIKTKSSTEDTSSAGTLLAEPAQSPWFPSPAPPNSKPCMVTQACNPVTQEVETRGSQVQCHPQLQRKFKASLGNVRSCLGKQKQ